MAIDTHLRTPRHRVSRWAATAALAATIVGGGTAVAVADGGSGTVDDPWVPTKGAHISCQSAGRYQNYVDGSHNLTNQVKDDYPTLAGGSYISVRYETGDRYAVMAMYHDANTKWTFILRSCVQFG